MLVRSGWQLWKRKGKRWYATANNLKRRAGRLKRELHRRTCAVHALPVTNWDENHAVMSEVGERTEDGGFLHDKRERVCERARENVPARRPANHSRRTSHKAA